MPVEYAPLLRPRSATPAGRVRPQEGFWPQARQAPRVRSVLAQPRLQRSVLENPPPPETAPPTGENEFPPLQTIAVGFEHPPAPESCPPPEEMSCPVPNTSAGTVTHAVHFSQGSAVLIPSERAAIDAVAASWNASGNTGVLRIDGFASAEGPCALNWNLSCQRAQAVRGELSSPSDGSPGVPGGQLEHFANGESDAAGTSLAPNRQATISLPNVPPPPPPPPMQVCAFPRLLGRARGCGSGTDFTHFDFPSISTRSAAKLAAWSATHPPFFSPLRSTVSTADCMAEMTGVLTGLGGGAGLAAMARFVAGTGGTQRHPNGSVLGRMALGCGSFLSTLAAVQADLEGQLATQAPSGILDPCLLATTPPATHFGFSDGVTLKTVIGGTQGERLFLNSFSGNAALRTYQAELRFLICDDFGVDESDLYFFGLFPFWVLQHERSASRFKPFINELDLTVTVSGTF